MWDSCYTLCISISCATQSVNRGCNLSDPRQDGIPLTVSQPRAEALHESIGMPTRLERTHINLHAQRKTRLDAPHIWPRDVTLTHYRRRVGSEHLPRRMTRRKRCADCGPMRTHSCGRMSSCVGSSLMMRGRSLSFPRLLSRGLPPPPVMAPLASAPLCGGCCRLRTRLSRFTRAPLLSCGEHGCCGGGGICSCHGRRYVCGRGVHRRIAAPSTCDGGSDCR